MTIGGLKRELPITLGASTLYLALLFLGTHAVRLVGHGLLQPLSSGDWSLRFLVTVGALELLLTGATATLVAWHVLGLSRAARRSLLVVGVLAGAATLLWPHALAVSASLSTVLASAAMRLVGPPLAARALAAASRS